MTSPWCYFWIVLDRTGLKGSGILRDSNLAFNTQHQFDSKLQISKFTKNLVHYWSMKGNFWWTIPTLLPLTAVVLFLWLQGNRKIFFGLIISMPCSSGPLLQVLQITIISGILSTSVLLLQSGHGKLT